MKKTATLLITVLIGTCMSLHSVGQNFSFSTLLINGWGEENGFSSNDVDIVNLTAGSLTFKWRTVENTFPVGWSLSLCDLGSCYPVPPDSALMNPTDLGGDAYFICHVSFNGIAGSGKLKLYTFELGDEANGDTVVFDYTTVPTGLNPIASEGITITTFPNPATDMLNIVVHSSEPVKALLLYDVKGTMVKSLKTSANNNYKMYLGNLMNGQYLLAVEGDGRIIATKNLMLVK